MLIQYNSRKYKQSIPGNFYLPRQCIVIIQTLPFYMKDIKLHSKLKRL